MQSPQLGSTRHILLQHKAEVLGRLGVRFDTLAQMGRVADDDQAQVTHDEFVSLRQNRLAYETLRLLDLALDRESHGEYGVCAECGESISVKRLRAIPWATHCVSCQERLAEQEDAPEQAEPAILTLD